MHDTSRYPILKIVVGKTEKQNFILINNVASSYSTCHSQLIHANTLARIRNIFKQLQIWQTTSLSLVQFVWTKTHSGLISKALWHFAGQKYTLLSYIIVLNEREEMFKLFFHQMHSLKNIYISNGQTSGTHNQTSLTAFHLFYLLYPKALKSIL